MSVKSCSYVLFNRNWPFVLIRIPTVIRSDVCIVVRVWVIFENDRRMNVLNLFTYVSGLSTFEVNYAKTSGKWLSNRIIRALQNFGKRGKCMLK